MVFKCFVPGCKTGYDSEQKKRKKEGKKNLSLFKAPVDMGKLQEWRKAIPRIDREMHTKDKVCELHFLPEEISREFVHNMPDGKVVVIERERVVLRADAVPTIFPSLPSYFSKNKRMRKPPVKRMPLPPKKTKRAKNYNTQPEETNTVDENDNAQPEKTNTVVKVPLKFKFNDLLKNLSQVSKPHKMWAVSSHEDFIVCVKWNVSFGAEFKCQPERQIVVDSNLHIKNLYYGTEVSITPNIVIESVESLSRILNEVDRYEVCPGAIKRNGNCSVYKKRIFGSVGRPYKWCDECKRNISKHRLNDDSSNFIELY